MTKIASGVVIAMLVLSFLAFTGIGVNEEPITFERIQNLIDNYQRIEIPVELQNIESILPLIEDDWGVFNFLRDFFNQILRLIKIWIGVINTYAIAIWNSWKAIWYILESV